MEDQEKTREQLIQELAGMRSQLDEVVKVELQRQDLMNLMRSYEKALHTMQLGVTITDLHGKILYTNPAEAQMHGYESDDLLGQWVRILAPPELWKPVPQEKINTFRSMKRESVNVRRDGSRFPVQLMSDVVRDDANQPVGIVTLSEDITERKLAEEALHQAYDEMEVKAQERSVELSRAVQTLNKHISDRKKLEKERRELRAQLVQSQKMEAIGHLAGGVAHDFNNILTTTMAYASLLEIKLEKESPLREDVKQIMEAMEKGAKITRSLLTFGRKQEHKPELTDLNEVVGSVEKLLRRLIGENYELKTELSPVPLAAMVDSGQIEQVLINLTTNARDSMPDGGLVVVKCEAVELEQKYANYYLFITPGEYACLSVSDTGQGMMKEVVDKIFDPFFTTKEEGKGTGLGLSISYGIVKQHKGAIGVYSEPGHGTSMKIYLPLERVEPGVREKVTVPPPRGGSETILLAEDEEATRRVIKELLEEYGYKVLLAENGEEALTFLRRCEGEIDMLLLDVIMPKKNGNEVIEEALKLRPDFKALLTSGYPEEVIKKRGIIGESTLFLHKPFSSHQLLGKIRAILDG